MHHIPDEHVDPLTRSIVSLGYDVNDKQTLLTAFGWDSFFTWDAVSVFCPGLEWRSHDFYGRHNTSTFARPWQSEIRGGTLTPLRWAISHGKASLVKALLDHGAQFPLLPEASAYQQARLHATTPEVYTARALDHPCYSVDILNMFLARHGNQKGRAVFAETPLGSIVMEPDCPERRLRLARVCTPENLAAVLTLLRAHQPGADPHLFRGAVMNGHVDVVRYLIHEGVDVELRHSGLTPLHTAIVYGRLKVFRVLLENGADAHALTTRKRISPMHLLFWRPKPAAAEIYMLEELYRRIGDASGRGGAFGDRVQPIHLAAMNSRAEAVSRLIELGADIGAALGEDVMPVFRGSRRRRGVVYQAERIDGSKVPPLKKPMSLTGFTPLGILLQCYKIFLPRHVLAMLRSLLAAAMSQEPANMRLFYTRPDIQQTVLHSLVYRQELMVSGIFESLLEKSGLHVNIGDAHSDTPLHYAAWHSTVRNTTVMDRLLGLGADPGLRNSHGMTPMAARAWKFIRQRQAAYLYEPHWLPPRLRKHFQYVELGPPEDELASNTWTRLRNADGGCGGDPLLKFVSVLYSSGYVREVRRGTNTMRVESPLAIRLK